MSARADQELPDPEVRFPQARKRARLITAAIVVLPVVVFYVQLARWNRAAAPIKALGASVQASGDGASAIWGPSGRTYVSFYNNPNLNDGELNSMIPDLTRFTELARLDLSNTRVTDQSIDGLATLTNVGEINLFQSQVSPAGLAKLKARLPNCRIYP